MSPLRAEPRRARLASIPKSNLIMATSSIFGAFGPLRKSIGSVTYSTLATARDGKRKQVARQKPTSVSNPNTVAQIMQRMKLAPAQRFYDAYERAVSKGIMSHSWEGVSYGNASRQEFMSRAMKNSAAVYVPKGYNAFAPGEYEVSAGSLPSLPWRRQIPNSETETAQVIFNFDTGLSNENVQKLLEQGLQLGDQITFLWAFEGNGETAPAGQYVAQVARINVGVGNFWEGDTLPEGFLAETGTYIASTPVAAIAFIVSRGQDSSAKRSNEKMLLVNSYTSLISTDALNAAIASYENGEAVTSLGSDWYLNNTPLAGQAVAGTAKTLSITAVNPDGVQKQADFFVVERVSNGQIGYLLVVDGNAGTDPSVAVQNGQVYSPHYEGQVTTVVKGEDVARGLVNAGYNQLGYIPWTAALNQQAGFTGEL